MASDPGVVAAFGGGMLSFLSPCVLPLVPGYLSLMSGVSLSEIRGTPSGPVGVRTRPHVVGSTLLFVAGFTLVFTALGLSASALGSALQDHRVGLNRVAGVVVIVMGLFLAGVVSSRTLMVERRLHVSPSQLGPWAPLVMGMAFAFGWTPCIGPILAGVLSVASNQDRVANGALLLIAYSAGLGVPFVLSGVALGRLTGVFDWFKRHSRVINLVAGLLLVAFGVLLFFDKVSWLSQRIIDLMARLGLDRLARI
jgi:cytochrome c-type biogenesis protein